MHGSASRKRPKIKIKIKNGRRDIEIQRGRPPTG
jgi:hypothetical protein